MKPTLFAVLLCVVGLVLPAAHAQGVNAKPLAYYQAKAEAGDLAAQTVLAQCFLNSPGKEKDVAEGIRWARKAATQNGAQAQALLGRCYVSGSGVEQDHKEGMRWLRKAAEQNNVTGQFGLGIGHMTGSGVEKDEKEAYAWLSLAARANTEAAAVRDLLEKQLSPEQVAAGQKRSEELRTLIAARLKSGGK